MKQTKRSADSILRQEALGFSIIIILSWATEFFHVPHLLFDEPPSFNWHRALLRTFVILFVWLWVHLATKKILKRLHHLEKFLLVCSWCKKVGHEGEWLTMEQFFGSKFDTETSHGMCPECARQAQARVPSKPPMPSI